jgi:hypothetical protein
LPLTFSFRVNEPSFFDDLQNFAKAFLALKQNINPDQIKQVDCFIDKYKLEHPVFYPFDIKIPQRAVVLSQLSGFKNVDATRAAPPTSFDAGKNMWILKPAWMSRGRGLELFTDLAQLNSFLKLYMGGYDTKDFSEMRYSDKADHSPSLNVEARNRSHSSRKN